MVQHPGADKGEAMAVLRHMIGGQHLVQVHIHLGGKARVAAQLQPPAVGVAPLLQQQKALLGKGGQRRPVAVHPHAAA